jgi:predicted component of type VI protein secretion system
VSSDYLSGPQHGGRVVPVYAFTAGRTRPTGVELPFEALVAATATGYREIAELKMEYRKIIEMGRSPISVVEVAAALGVPIGVARVLMGDLADIGYLDIQLPRTHHDGAPTRDVLERLLHGLRAR